MTPLDDPYVLIPGILLSLFLIGLAVRYILKVVVPNTETPIARLAIATFTIVCCVWVLDKIAFVNRHILSENESNRLFDIMFAMFTAYLVEKKNDNKQDQKEKS